MERKIASAKKAIENDCLIVLPTDTVYGIGTSAKNPDNIKAILQAKGRDGKKPLPVLVASIDQAKEIADIEEKYLPFLEKFWPGALTVIFPMKPGLGWYLGDKNSTIALRIPDNELTISLLSETGPLAVTSANLTNLPPAITVAQAKKYFESKVKVYIDGGQSKSGISSTIIDLTKEQPKILRKGDISEEMLKEFLINIKSN